MRSAVQNPVSSSPPDRSDGAPVLELPIHDLPVDVLGRDLVRRRRGRPRKIRTRPTFDETQYLQEKAEDLRRHVAADPLVNATRGRTAGAELLHLAMLELARECASLLWDREVAQEKGSDFAIIASRRVDALSKLAGLVLALQRLGETDMMVSEGTFTKLRSVWLAMIADVATNTLPVEDAGRLLARYGAVLATVRAEDVHEGRLKVRE